MAGTSSIATEFLVNGKYRLVRKIGSGSFGDIYLGINITNGEVRRCYAISVAVVNSMKLLKGRQQFSSQSARKKNNTPRSLSPSSHTSTNTNE